MIWQDLGKRMGSCTLVAMRRQATTIAAVTLAVVTAAGCAGLGGISKDSPPDEKRAAVTERVNARWAALMKGDMETAYTFFSPASRQLLTLGTYKQQARGSGFRNAEVTKVDCQPETCEVTVLVTLDHRKMPGLQSPVDETWVLENGKYWLTWRN
jgi:hypothetical protein